jgi:hypothetical protein
MSCIVRAPTKVSWEARKEVILLRRRMLTLTMPIHSHHTSRGALSVPVFYIEYTFFCKMSSA